MAAAEAAVAAVCSVAGYVDLASLVSANLDYIVEGVLPPPAPPGPPPQVKLHLLSQYALICIPKLNPLICIPKLNPPFGK